MGVGRVRLVAVIPVGPTCRPEFVADTVASIEHFTTSDRAIVLVDDNSTATCGEVAGLHPGVVVWRSSHRGGRGARLYRNLATVFDRVLDTFDFDALLRIDTDALVIGPHPEDDAIERFLANPLVGAAGNYRYEYGGERRDQSWQIDQVHRQTSNLRSIVRRPRGALALRQLLRQGATAGDEVFGGACFYSQPGLRGLQRRGWLPHGGIAHAYLEEDHLFGLTMRACGFEFVDLWDQTQSFACSWGRLPASPETLALGPAKVTHSVRSYGARDEAAVREAFRAHRCAPAAPSSIAAVGGTVSGRR